MTVRVIRQAAAHIRPLDPDSVPAIGLTEWPPTPWSPAQSHDSVRYA